jgi:hypothetical protein
MAEGGRKWFKLGCFGCLGILVILIVITLILSFTAWLKVRHEEVVEQVIDHAVPVASGPVETGGLTAEEAAQPEVTPGKVTLDLTNGEFHIAPAKPGEPIHVKAVYDTASYELDENFQSDGVADWSYRVHFHKTSSSLLSPLKALLGASSPEVHVFLPPDVPINLDLILSQGGAFLELGGLWLTNARFDFSMGGFEMDIDEPLRHPMERLSLNISMGGGEISSLGNASPRYLEVTHRMGGMDLDLRGQWMQDSEISINSSMGGGLIRLPRNVAIRGLDSKGPGPPDDSEIKPPTLTFSVASKMGELEIMR